MPSPQLFRRVPLLAALIFMVCAVGAVGAQDTSQPYFSISRPNVLMMTSSSVADADIARQALSYALTTVNFPVTFVDDAKLLNAQTLSQFQVFVQFGPARYTPDQEKALADFVQNGGGFLALHDALDGPPGGAYEKLLGGSLVRHAGPYHIVIHLTDNGRKSPLTSGVQDFEILEDQIFPNYLIDQDVPHGGWGSGRGGGQAGPPHGLMTGFAMDNTSDPERLKLRTNIITNPIAGWWREIGKGRVCYLAPGDNFATMNNPMMQKLYTNALVWLARQN